MAIPKIIHYSWFSGEEFPEEVKECMSTWKRVLPDYEFVLWDADKLSELNNVFANEAVSVKKWAFASDFVRVYAVYTYGGIWLDTDVEMYKSFDPFLKHQMFIGREGWEQWKVDDNHTTISYLTSHCFGAEPNHPFLKLCLDFYTNRHFIKSKNEAYPQHLRYDMTILPALQAELAIPYGYKWGNEDDETQYLKDGIVVYPHDYFDFPKYTDMTNVVCIHRAFGAWVPIHHDCSWNDKYTHATNDKRRKIIYRTLVCFNKCMKKMKIAIKIIPTNGFQ